MRINHAIIKALPAFAGFYSRFERKVKANKGKC
jgi:hypothetical protein